LNAPNLHELFALEDSEKTLELSEDTKIPNAATFKTVKQDRTLGNMLHAQLLTSPVVLLAGYKTPHPLHPHCLLKIQTNGSVTPALPARLPSVGSSLPSPHSKPSSDVSSRSNGETGGVAGGFNAGAGMGGESDPYGGGAAAWGGII
ncbi:DNA-directed RNA polymerase, partial [Mycena metata]